MKKGGTMKHLFKSELFKIFSIMLVIFIVIKILWLVVGFTLLSSNGVHHKKKVGGKSLYYRVKLTPNEAPPPKVKPVKNIKVSSIKDITLQAVYNSSDTTVVTIGYKKKTKILGRGDKVNGFTLVGGGSNYATFSKNSEMYKVELANGKKSTTSSSSMKITKPSVTSASKKKKVNGEVTDAGDHKIVDKSLIDFYSKNPEDMYKNIGITEVKDGKSVNGFKVTFVRRGSAFSKLGLKRGDIIKAINGQEVNGYGVALETYKNIGKAEGLTLAIERGKEKMELEYEVN